MAALLVPVAVVDAKIGRNGPLKLYRTHIVCG